MAEFSLLRDSLCNTDLVNAASSSIFNAKYLEGIPVDVDLIYTGLPGDVLTFNGTEFILLPSGISTDFSQNIAIGNGSLSRLTNGYDNIAIGTNAGSSLSNTESDNILIGSVGQEGDTKTTRIGDFGEKDACFISGIRGITTHVLDSIPVVIDSSGQLGTVSSSERYKTDIRPISSKTVGLLDNLKPVEFYMKPDTEKQHLQYGLIAEDVSSVLPSLVYYKTSPEGRKVPETVYYQHLISILIASHQELKTNFSYLSSRVNALQEIIVEINSKL